MLGGAYSGRRRAATAAFRFPNASRTAMDHLGIPTSSAPVRHLLENPWLPALAILFAGLLVGWLGVTRGERRLLIAGIVASLAAATWITVGTLVRTPGERACELARSIVAAAERGDAAGMLAEFAPDATFHYGRPDQPGLPFGEIADAAAAIEGRYRIESNSVTQLDPHTDPDRPDTGYAVLSCRTVTAASPAPTPSSWVLRAVRGPDGRWTIDRLTLVKVAGRDPWPRLWR
jgi:hypothetical protein